MKYLAAAGYNCFVMGKNIPGDTSDWYTFSVPRDRGCAQTVAWENRKINSVARRNSHLSPQPPTPSP
ncbi:MAG: hypothetical protein OHK0022_54900 [Roseiflexaceae bacterium]